MKIMLCIALLFNAMFLQAQTQEFKLCIDNTFMKWDSLSKIDKDPFELWRECVIGKKIPPFDCTTMSGTKLNADILKNRIVIFNMISVSCEPCIAEVPALNRFVKTFAGTEVELIGITPDKAEVVNELLFSKYPAEYKVVTDDPDMAGMFGRTGFPAFFIIKNGVIADAWIGGNTTAGPDNPIYELLKAKLDLLRNEK